jgi:hypothetical protein
MQQTGSRKPALLVSVTTTEKWPPWSTGEILAVALILDDAGMFIALDITKQEALDRLRYDLELPDIVGAARWFADLRAQL